MVKESKNSEKESINIFRTKERSLDSVFTNHYISKHVNNVKFSLQPRSSFFGTISSVCPLYPETLSSSSRLGPGRPL